jgi:hypothetical protein
VAEYYLLGTYCRAIDGGFEQAAAAPHSYLDCNPQQVTVPFALTAQA